MLAYYWATMMIVGNTEPVILSTISSYSNIGKWIGSGIIVLIILLLILFFRRSLFNRK